MLGINGAQLPVVGNVGKSLGLWGDPAEENYQRIMSQVMQMVQQYRPMEAEARMNALRQQLPLFNPLSTALKSAYGPQYGIDTSTLAQNPMPAGMTGVGAPGGGGGGGILGTLMGARAPQPFAVRGT